VINHEVDRYARIDFFRVASKAGHCATHGGEVNNGRNAGEVLQQDACRHERDFDLGRAGRVVCSQFFHVGFFDEEAVAIPQCAFQQHFDGIGKAIDSSVTLVAQRIQAVEDAGARTCVEGLTGTEEILVRRLSRAHDNIGWTPEGR